MKSKSILVIVVSIAVALLGFSCSTTSTPSSAAKTTGSVKSTSSSAVASSTTATTPSKTQTLNLTHQPSAASTSSTTAVSSLDCKKCHSDIYASWASGPHAKTQADVASELSTDRAGQTPHDVIQGSDPEDCIFCHDPSAVLANGGMTETTAIGYFFTTTGGKFGQGTTPAHSAAWQNVSCTDCHQVPSDHPTSKTTLAVFNSQTGKYIPVANAADLCAQCHGNLHFSDTDHLTYNAWTQSKHAATQKDVASELSVERVGQSPHDVIQGSDAEDCIACHAPTAVEANGGMSETMALGYFFSTTNGLFTKNTVATHTADWPNVSCIVCHNPINPKTVSYFNSSTGKYEQMQSTTELCAQCHGNLRFPDTDHLSYNILTGTGGIGVKDQQTMPGATCVDCHMFASDVDGSNSASFHGHTFAIMVKESGGKSTVSCATCHKTMDAAEATKDIAQFKSSFQTLDTTASKNVTSAADAMKGVKNADLTSKLNEAQHNLDYAESDESGGFHNHTYLMSLLKDANDKAVQVLAALSH